MKGGAGSFTGSGWYLEQEYQRVKFIIITLWRAFFTGHKWKTQMLIHAGIQEDGFLVVLQESEGAEKKSKIFCWGNTSSGLKILGKWSQREGDQDPKHTLASWRSVSVSLVHKREAVSEALTCIAYVLAGNWKQRPQDLTEISIRPCHGLSELFIFGHVCSWDNRGSSHLQLYPRATAAPFILKS